MQLDDGAGLPMVFSLAWYAWYTYLAYYRLVKHPLHKKKKAQNIHNDFSSVPLMSVKFRNMVAGV